MELANEKRKHFLKCLFFPKEISLRFVFYLNVLCIEYALRIYILLHIKKHCFIYYCCFFLKSSKAFSECLIVRWVIKYNLISLTVYSYWTMCKIKQWCRLFNTISSNLRFFSLTQNNGIFHFNLFFLECFKLPFSILKLTSLWCCYS